MKSRPEALAGIIALIAAGGLVPSALAGSHTPKERKKKKRRAKNRRRKRRTVRRRRRIRRRHRRRVGWRKLGTRRRLVVPVALIVGWELVVDDRVVVVRAIQARESEGVSVEVVTVVASDGSEQTVEILREDSSENGEELEGSLLPEGDESSPGIASEIEEEVEVDE